MNPNYYQEAIDLLRNNLSDKDTIFDAVSDIQQSTPSSLKVKTILSLAFKDKVFVKHIPINSETIDNFKLLIMKVPEARRELAANPSAPIELLNVLAENDMDYGVILALRKQVEQREDLKELKVSGAYIKTNQEQLQSIADRLNNVSKIIQIPSNDVGIVNDHSLGIENKALLIYLTDSKPQEDYKGWIYHQRLHELRQPYTIEGIYDEPDTSGEKELGLYSSISGVITEAIAAHARISAQQFIELNGETEDHGMGMQ